MRVFLKIVLFTVIFTFSRYAVCSENIYVVDSIDLIINNASISNSIKVDKLLNKGELLAGGQPEAALQYYENAEALARKINNPGLLFKIMNRKGILYYSMGDFKNTLLMFLAIEKIALKLNDSIKISTVNLNLGSVYDELGDYKSALDYSLKSLQIDEALNDSVGMASCYLNLGALCAKYEQNDRALEFLDKAGLIAYKMGIVDVMYYCNNNIGLIYFGEGDYEKALVNYNEALGVVSQLGEPEQVAILKSNIGLVYVQLGDFDKAEEYFMSANTISTDNLLISVGISSSLNLGFLYLKLSENTIGDAKKEYLSKLFSFVQPTIEISKENDDHENELFAYELLLDYYELQGDFGNYCGVQDAFVKLLREMNKTKNNMELELLKNKYKAEKQAVIIEKLEKENELKKLQHDNQNLYLVISILLFLASLVVVAILYRMFLLKSRNNKELNKKNIRINNLVVELKTSNTVKDKFFSIIAHDLQSPFNMLIGMSGLLKTSADDFSIVDVKKYAAMINNASTNTFQLLTELLQWSHLQTKSITAQPTDIEVYKIIENNLELYNKQAEEKGIKLENKVEKGIFVFADPKMLNTIFRNLISNAIKFTAQGKIIITAEASNGFVNIAVSDTGVGISSKNADKIFKVGEMFTTSGTSSEMGTGFGLLLCKEMVELNGGVISLKSKEGQGTELSFTLPIPKSK